MNMPHLPKSVSDHIVKANPELWGLRKPPIQWHELGTKQNYLIAGSSFIDPDDPAGSLGNPFVVVVGPSTGELADRKQVAQQTNTPETVFINSCQAVNEGSELSLTVLTPSGQEMGACAHGFIGAVQTLISLGQLPLGRNFTIHTTIATTAQGSVSPDGQITLSFTPQPPRSTDVPLSRLVGIYGSKLGEARILGILSVGSPKLTIELTPAAFSAVQQNLNRLNFQELLALQAEFDINGIHLFCRDPHTHFPARCIQNNAYSGPDNFADRATGVSNAAQIAADSQVPLGQTLSVTQYVATGPSAILNLTKAATDRIDVGGAAALFGYREVLH